MTVKAFFSNLFAGKEEVPQALAPDALSADLPVSAEQAGTQSIMVAEFSERVRDLAGHLEAAYWLSMKVSREWYSRPELAELIPFDAKRTVDGNYGKPLTNMDIYGILNRADELVADCNANNFAKLNTIIKASNIPAE